MCRPALGKTSAYVAARSLHRFHHLPPRAPPTAAARLQLQAAAALKLPVIVTEQYPKALGHTVEELLPHIPEGSPGAPPRTLSRHCRHARQRKASAAPLLPACAP